MNEHPNEGNSSLKSEPKNIYCFLNVNCHKHMRKNIRGMQYQGCVMLKCVVLLRYFFILLIRNTSL